MTYVAKNEAQAEAYEMLGVSYVLGADTEPEVDDSNRRQTTSKMSTPSPSKAKAKLRNEMIDVGELLQMHEPDPDSTLTMKQLRQRIRTLGTAIGYLEDVESGLNTIGERGAALEAKNMRAEVKAMRETYRTVSRNVEQEHKA